MSSVESYPFAQILIKFICIECCAVDSSDFYNFLFIFFFNVFYFVLYVSFLCGTLFFLNWIK